MRDFDEYLSAGDGDVLLIHRWDSDDPEESFDRFTRFEDAPTAGGPPPTLRGKSRQTYACDEDEGGLVTRIRTLAFFGPFRRAQRATRWPQWRTRGRVVTEGGWTDTGTSASKTFFDDGQMTTVDKQGRPSVTGWSLSRIDRGEACGNSGTKGRAGFRSNSL